MEVGAETLEQKICANWKSMLLMQLAHMPWTEKGIVYLTEDTQNCDCLNVHLWISSRIGKCHLELVTGTSYLVFFICGSRM